MQLLVALYAFAAWQYFWPPWTGSTDWRAHVGGVLGGFTCGLLLRNFDCPLVLTPWSSESIKILGIPRESNARYSPDLSPRPGSASASDQSERDSRDLGGLARADS